MNKEVIKAMNNKEKNGFSKWWKKYRKFIRFPFYIIRFIIKVTDKIKLYRYKKLKWSEERADKILSYYVPRSAKWDNENKEFYFVDNGYGWGMKCWRRKVKIKDRRWWKKYTCGWGGEVRKYLIEEFELDGFEKEVDRTDDFWTEITFKLKGEN